MARAARFTPAGVPLHITQRGNFRHDVFRTDAERELYLQLLGYYSARHRVQLLGWCLMSNHVHLIAMGDSDDAISKLMCRVQSEYSRSVNHENGVSGNLWTSRFWSCLLGPSHLWTALAYVELNPVRAGLVREPVDWKWSSSQVHCGLGRPAPTWVDMEMWRQRFVHAEWRERLSAGLADGDLNGLRRATRRGIPFASTESLIAMVQRRGNAPAGSANWAIERALV